MKVLHSRSHLIYVSLAVFFLTAIQDICAQITYTRSFTRKLEKADMEYLESVEQWLHVVPDDRDQFMKYDLVLENDRNDFEVRYRIRRGRHSRLPLHVEVPRLASSIASNQDGSEIHMTFPDSTFLMTHFNARSGIFADFAPKAAFSEKPYGTLVCLGNDEDACVDIVILRYNPDYNALDAFRNIRFR